MGCDNPSSLYEWFHLTEVPSINTVYSDYRKLPASKKERRVKNEAVEECMVQW